MYSIEEVGGFVQISMDELRSSGNAHDMETHGNIVSTIANFSLQIVLTSPLPHKNQIA